MPKSYPLRKVQIQFYDGNATTPNTINLAYFGSVPELPDVVVNRNLEVRLDRGQFSHVDFGDDALEFPEVTLTIDMVDTHVSTNKHALEQWFNQHQTVDGTDLVSTNDGGAQARDVDTGELVDIGLPTSIFTIGMKILFSDADDTNSFGRDYKYVKPIEARVSAGDTGGQIILRMQLLGTYTEISNL